MSWKVGVYLINHIKPIPEADSIECAFINNWPIVIRKGQFKTGDKVVYFPADSIMPESLLVKMGLSGKLAGPQKNRIKCIKLKNQLSIGLIILAESFMNVGDDVAAYYGVTRYEAPIPIELAGVATKLPDNFIKYDVENIRSYPNEFIEGETIVILEKIHGSSQSITMQNGQIYVCSRNISLQESKDNTYWMAARNSINHLSIPDNCFIHGECVPTQDLKYGFNEPRMLVFDIRYGNQWLNYDDMKFFCDARKIAMVPLLYYGPYSPEVVDKYTSGHETLSGKNLHIREGCVIRPQIERLNSEGKRLILKSINPDYLLRKGGTEYH